MNKKKSLIIGIAVAVVLAAVMLILIFAPKGGGSDDGAATIDEGIDMIATTDENGIHQVQVQTDKDGSIINNSYGTLMEYVPAQIKEIHVENNSGTFDVISNTPEGEATVYTIKGFEDFALQAGEPDLIANAAATLSFSKVATVDKDKSGEFGFDKPRSTVTVTYEDGTKSIITVGSDAPQAAGTYIKFGTGDAVFVVDTETISPFDYSLTDLISKSINDSADTTDNSQASSIKLSGTAFDKEIELVPYTDNKISASYKMKAPVERIAGESESSKVEGGIRGLYATSVSMVNPSDKQLSDLGLSKPYAHLTAVYPDTTVDLIASKPDGNGNVTLMENGGNVVYVIAADKVPWTMTSYEKLVSEYVLNPKMTALTGVKVQANSKTYEFSLSSHESTTTDDEGNETTSTVTVVQYGGKEMDLGAFSAFYDTISLIGLADPDTAGAGGNSVLTVEYTYADGSSDKVAFTDAGSDLYNATLNGTAAGHCHKADVTRAVKGLEEVISVD